MSPITLGSVNVDADELNEGIIKQGNIVRDLKSAKASKDDIGAAVASLLDLKAKYKAATSKDWKPGVHKSGSSKESSKVSRQNQSIIMYLVDTLYNLQFYHYFLIGT